MGINTNPSLYIRKSWQFLPLEPCPFFRFVPWQDIPEFHTIFMNFPKEFLEHLEFHLIGHSMRIKQLITILLLTSVVVMMTLVPLSMASHSIDHHHHSAGTHTTGICAWMCTAAQTISTDSQIFSPNISRLEILEIQPISTSASSLPPFLPTRAPPR